MAGFVRIRQVESRPNLSFGRTLRLSSDRHDLIPPPLAAIRKKEKIPLSYEDNDQKVIAENQILMWSLVRSQKKKKTTMDTS